MPTSNRINSPIPGCIITLTLTRNLHRLKVITQQQDLSLHTMSRMSWNFIMRWNTKTPVMSVGLSTCLTSHQLWKPLCTRRSHISSIRDTRLRLARYPVVVVCSSGQYRFFEILTVLQSNRLSAVNFAANSALVPIISCNLKPIKPGTNHTHSLITTSLSLIFSIHM